MKTNTKVTIGIFLRILLSSLLLNSQDTTLVNNLSMLTISVQNLSSLLKPDPGITLSDQEAKILANKIVFFGFYTPTIITHSIISLVRNNTFIIQNVTATGEPFPTDFQVSLRTPNEINGFLLPLLSQQYPVNSHTTSFDTLNNTQKIQILVNLIVPQTITIHEKGKRKTIPSTIPAMLNASALTEQLREKMRNLGQFHQRYPEPVPTPLSVKAVIIVNSELIFIKLYFMGILSSIATVQLTLFQDILKRSEIFSALSNIASLPAFDYTLTDQEHALLSAMLNQVVQNYVISKFPKTEEWQEYGLELQKQLREALDKSRTRS